MPYIAPEVVTEAKRMDLLTYLRTYEPGQLVRVSGNTYCTREHDSLKISNGKWMWWSRGIGGRTALDYLIKVKELSFIEAVETIMGNCVVTAPVYETESRSYEEQPLLLPQKSPTSEVVTQYLFGRGIDYEIIALDDYEHGIVIRSLNDEKTDLMNQGKSTDAVDDLIIKVGTAPKKKFKVISKDRSDAER